MTDVLLASGGLDSSLLAAMYPDTLHLSVDYGQDHRRELAAAAAVAAHYGAEHLVMVAPFGPLVRSAITGGPGHKVGTDTVVPARNSILLSLALAVAVDRGAESILIGANLDDSEHYLDCRPEFIVAFGRVAGLHGVILRAPLLSSTKADIGRRARALGVPVELTWSCYLDGPAPCGACGACLTRKEAACS